MPRSLNIWCDSCELAGASPTPRLGEKGQSQALSERTAGFHEVSLTVGAEKTQCSMWELRVSEYSFVGLLDSGR